VAKEGAERDSVLNTDSAICTEIGKRKECRVCYKGISSSIVARESPGRTNSRQVKDSTTVGKTSLSARGIVVVPTIASTIATSPPTLAPHWLPGVLAASVTELDVMFYHWGNGSGLNPSRNQGKGA
jgi:hypothetical protein